MKAQDAHVQHDDTDTIPERPRVVCPCNHPIYDGEVIRSRVIRVLDAGAEAKCPRCKRWNLVPVTYCPVLEA